MCILCQLMFAVPVFVGDSLQHSQVTLFECTELLASPPIRRCPDRDVSRAGSSLDACGSKEASRGRCFHEGWELPGLASHPFCGQAAAGRKNAGTASGCFSGVGVDVHIKPSLATATVASPSPISRCSWHFLEVTTGAVCSQHQSFCRIYTLWL